MVTHTIESAPETIPTYISHPDAKKGASACRSCIAYSFIKDATKAIDCCMPIGSAYSNNAITRMIREAIGGDWVVVASVPLPVPF